jgi:hypothetical protein
MCMIPPIIDEHVLLFRNFVFAVSTASSMMIRVTPLYTPLCLPISLESSVKRQATKARPEESRPLLSQFLLNPHSLFLPQSTAHMLRPSWQPPLPPMLSGDGDGGRVRGIGREAQRDAGRTAARPLPTAVCAPPRLHPTSFLSWAALFTPPPKLSSTPRPTSGIRRERTTP